LKRHSGPLRGFAGRPRILVASPSDARDHGSSRSFRAARAGDRLPGLFRPPGPVARAL